MNLRKMNAYFLSFALLTFCSNISQAINAGGEDYSYSNSVYSDLRDAATDVDKKYDDFNEQYSNIFKYKEVTVNNLMLLQSILEKIHTISGNVSELSRILRTSSESYADGAVKKANSAQEKFDKLIEIIGNTKISIE